MSTKRSHHRNRIPKHQQPQSRKLAPAPEEPEPDWPEFTRAKAVRRLADLGQRRQRLVAELDAVDAELRPLVVGAAAATLPYRRIEELTGIPRATVGRWVKAQGPDELQ